MAEHTHATECADASDHGAKLYLPLFQVHNLSAQRAPPALWQSRHDECCAWVQTVSLIFGLVIITA